MYCYHFFSLFSIVCIFYMILIFFSCYRGVFFSVSLKWATIQAKKICVFTVTCWKENRVGRSDLFFFLNIVFLLKFSEFGSQELLFVIFLCLLTILNTHLLLLLMKLSHLVPEKDKISKILKIFKNFPIKSSRVGVKK